MRVVGFDWVGPLHSHTTTGTIQEKVNELQHDRGWVKAGNYLLAFRACSFQEAVGQLSMCLSVRQAARV